jgi:hypothetical protein
MSAFSAVFDPGLFVIKRYGVGAKDALGRPTRVLTSTSEPVDGLLSLTGTVEGEAYEVNKFRATLPLGTDLRSADEVVAEGEVYTVEGKPAEFHAPGSRSVGVVTAVLKYVGPVTS